MKTTSGTESSAEDLRLDLKIVKMRNVNPGSKGAFVARIILGPFASREELEIDDEFFDQKTKRAIGSFNVVGKSGTVFAVTFSESVERVAEQIAEFAERNR